MRCHRTDAQGVDYSTESLWHAWLEQDWRSTTAMCLLCVRHHTRCLTRIISTSPHNLPIAGPCSRKGAEPAGTSASLPHIPPSALPSVLTWSDLWPHGGRGAIYHIYGKDNLPEGWSTRRITGSPWWGQGKRKENPGFPLPSPKRRTKARIWCKDILLVLGTSGRKASLHKNQLKIRLWWKQHTHKKIKLKIIGPNP